MVAITVAGVPAAQGPQFTQVGAQATRQARQPAPGGWTPGTASMVHEPASLAEQRRQREDEERRRIERLRPADKSVRAVQAALDSIVAERARADARVASCQANVDALADGQYRPPEQCQAALNALELAQIDSAQFERMECGMRVSLEQAERVEAEELDALAASVPVAAAKVSAFRRFVEKDYPALAAKIAAGLALEAEAEEAVGVLRAASGRLGHDAPDPLPRVRNGLAEEAYRFRMSLPGTDVKPLARWEGAPSVRYA